jgi:hypothetical protein
VYKGKVPNNEKENKEKRRSHQNSLGNWNLNIGK